jgi:hypothetical protein
VKATIFKEKELCEFKQQLQKLQGNEKKINLLLWNERVI